MRSKEEAHRRALADVNGDPQPRVLRELVSLALFVIGLLFVLAVLTGHVSITIH